MKICLIVNPAAGSGHLQKMVNKAGNHLAQMGCTVKQVETAGAGDAIRLARQAADESFDVAVAIGGDGTINEVCNGLVGTETALGILPAGTGNVYAADIGIPIWWPLNPDAILKAAEIITTGQRRRIDLGRTYLADGSSRYFLMWCGIGLDAAISQARQPTPMRSLGYVGWALASLMVIFDFMGTRAQISLDEHDLSKRILAAVVSNGQLYGRVWRLAAQARMDDGLLDVAILSGHAWPSTFRHLIGLTFGRHVKDPDFHLYRTTRFSLRAREPLPVHVDGEIIGTTPVEVEVAPLALNIIIPHTVPNALFERQPGAEEKKPKSWLPG